MNITQVGIDLAKLVFQVHGVDARGKVTLRKQRGDKYLRTLLIHGARSVFFSLKRNPARADGWLARVANRRNPNIAAVALANKNARIVWALLAHGRDYQADYRSAST
jgi:transposase